MAMGMGTAAPETVPQQKKPKTYVPPTQSFGISAPEAAQLPLGLRHSNNVLNIKYYKGAERNQQKWPGLLGPSIAKDQGDPQMLFATPEDSVAAGAGLLRRKYDSGMRTPRQIIAGKAGWTPGYTGAAENVGRIAGTGADGDLRLDTPEGMRRMLPALAEQEHGPAATKRLLTPDFFDRATEQATGAQFASGALPKLDLLDPTGSNAHRWGQPTQPHAMPPSNPAEPRMALGGPQTGVQSMATPRGMGGAPPSMEEIALYQARAKPFLAANDGSPTSGWGAVGRIASSITGNLWMDQAQKGLQAQRAQSADLLDAYTRAGMGGARPSQPMQGIGATPPVAAAPSAPQRPRVTGPAPVSTGVAAAGATLPASGADRMAVPIADGGALAYDTRAPAIGRPPEVIGQGGPMITTTVPPPDRGSSNVEDMTGANAPQPVPGANGSMPSMWNAHHSETASPPQMPQVHGNFDEFGRWKGESSGADSLGGGPEADTLQDNPLAARTMGADALQMFADPPQQPAQAQQPHPARTAPSLTSPRPAFDQTPDVLDTVREREQEALLSRMMASGNPHLMQFAQGQLAAINQKRLQFGLQTQQAQLQKQMALEQDKIKQLLEVDQMLALGGYTPEQAASLKASIERSYGGQGGNAAPATGANGGSSGGASGQAASAPGGVSSLNPPGTRPGGMVAQHGVEASMVPLSDEARRAQQMAYIGGLRSNRAMVQASENLLKNDPTLEARKAQSTEMGKSAAQRAEAKRAGLNILKSFAHLRHGFDQTPDPELQAAIGPYNTAKLGSPGWGPSGWIMPQQAENMTPPEYAKAFPTRAALTSSGDARGYDTQNRFNHLIHGLTNAFMTGAGKGLNMSDERQKAFEKTMGDFMRSSNRTEANKILGDVRTIIQNDFGLSPEEADAVITQELNGLGGGHGAPSAASQPSQAAPVRVNSPEEAARLPSGTRFMTHDGREMVKH